MPPEIPRTSDVALSMDTQHRLEQRLPNYHISNMEIFANMTFQTSPSKTSTSRTLY
jgi:hypothetical protein